MADGHAVRTVEGLERRRRARPGAAGLHGGARAAVRLLHAGDDDDRPRAARPQPGPDRGRDPRGASPARSAAAPATRTSCARSAGPPSTRPPRGRRHDDHREHRPPAPGRQPRSASAGCCARRTRGSSAARATTSTTSSCPACCTARSCAARYAHARIVSIDTVGRRGAPEGARPSSPARTSRRSSLAWMPTLSHDVQAVLATDKVRFQGQEVAFVVAEDRYSARDALELIDVEYEPLPAGRRRQAGARPRTPRSSATTSRARPTTTSSTGSPATRPRRDAVFAGAEVVVTQDMLYPARAPAPMETCGTVARHGPGHRQADGLVDHPGTARAPHAVRAGRRASPSTRSGSSRPDIGGGFGNKVGDLPRLRAARSSARSSPASR